MHATIRIKDGAVWVGTRRMPETAHIKSFDLVSEALPDDGRRYVLHDRGFSLPFESGWNVDVEWGQSAIRHPAADAPFKEEAEAATVIVSDGHGRVVVWDNDGRPMGKSLDHSGHRSLVPAADVLAIIDDVARWPSDHLDVIDRR